MPQFRQPIQYSISIKPFFFLMVQNTYQVVQLNGVNTLVDTGDDLLCDSRSIDMIRIKAVTQSRHTSRDLIELYTLFTSVC